MFRQNVFHPDITIMVDWALKIIPYLAQKEVSVNERVLRPSACFFVFFQFVTMEVNHLRH